MFTSTGAILVRWILHELAYEREEGSQKIHYSHEAKPTQPGSFHFMKYAAWIYCTRWHPQLLPAADSRAPRPMKPND